MSSTSDVALRANQLPVTVDIPKDEERFHEFLSLNIKRTASTVNTKTGGLYNLEEQFNSNQFYTANNPNIFRNVYRKTFDLVLITGAPIGAGAAIVTPHAITGLFETALIYASCKSVEATPRFFTVVYPDVFLDSTNINFTNPLGVTLSQCVVVAEYVKN